MRTRKRGGQIVHYTRDKPWHHRWKPLKSHNMDCGPNCFALLKYANRETCEELARRTKGGIAPMLIIQLLDQAYGDDHQWQTISKAGYDEIYNDEPDGYTIGDLLGDNEATFASIEYGDFLHFFVVLKDDEGYHAIDAQTHESLKLKTYMEEFSSNYGHCQLSIVLSNLHQREPYKVTMNMVKRMFPFGKEQEQEQKKNQQRLREKQIAEEKRLRKKEKTLRKSEMASMKMADRKSK